MSHIDSIFISIKRRLLGITTKQPIQVVIRSIILYIQKQRIIATLRRFTYFNYHRHRCFLVLAISFYRSSYRCISIFMNRERCRIIRNRHNRIIAYRVLQQCGTFSTVCSFSRRRILYPNLSKQVLRCHLCRQTVKTIRPYNHLNILICRFKGLFFACLAMRSGHSMRYCDFCFTLGNSSESSTLIFNHNNIWIRRRISHCCSCRIRCCRALYCLTDRNSRFRCAISTCPRDGRYRTHKHCLCGMDHVVGVLITRSKCQVNGCIRTSTRGYRLIILINSPSTGNYCTSGINQISFYNPRA